MKALLALVFLLSLLAIVISFALLFVRRLRRKAAAGLVFGIVGVLVAAYASEPPDGQRVAAAPATTIRGDIPATATARAPAASPTPVAGHAGKARICLDRDQADTLKATDVLELPATTTFEDRGRFTGRRDDPSSWGYKAEEGTAGPGKIAITDPVRLTRAAPCADAVIEIVGEPAPAKAGDVKVDAGRVFSIRGVIDYPVSAKRQPIEIGKLVDDIGVLAVPRADATLRRPDVRQDFSEEEVAASCLKGARQLAAHLGAGVGQQTSMIVALDDLKGQEVTFGCGNISNLTPDVFIAWSGSATPPKAKKALIGKAASFVTGVSPAEVVSESAACVSAALKPDAMETADRQFRGAKVECQAYRRDGGGGSVTIYRRFGAPPAHADPDAAQDAAIRTMSDRIAAKTVGEAAQSRAFVDWWNDPSVPKGVKTFAALAARVIALGERCPTAKDHSARIAEWASQQGLSSEDMQPGGRWSALVAQMLSEMRSETGKESVEEACAGAARYD